MSENVRGSILEFIRRYPAVHVREIERQLGLSDRLASYHLQVLAKAGLVRAVEEKGFLRYVASTDLRSRAEIRQAAALRHAPAYKIAVVLAEAGELTPGEIARRLSLARASAAYHLHQMLKTGLLKVRTVGRNRFYRPADHVELRRLLKGLPAVPGALDEFSRVWDQLFS